MFCLIGFFSMVQKTTAISCQRSQMEYNAKFITKSNIYRPIESKPLVNWLYQQLLQINIHFPWSKRFLIVKRIRSFTLTH